LDSDTPANRVPIAPETHENSTVLKLDRTTHENLTAGLPDPLREAAADAYEAFEALPMPSDKEEDWRYVAVPERLGDMSLPDSPGANPSPSDVEAALGDLAGRADIVDGHVVGFAGDVVATLDGAELDGYSVQAPVDRFAAAAGAFGGSGIVVRAPRGQAVTEPVYVSMEAATSGALSVPRLLVVADEASQISVVVEQRAADGLGALVLPDIEVISGPAARASVTVIQTWGDDTVAVGRHRMRAGRDGFVELAEAGLGAGFSRLHLTVDLEGRGADARITGAYFGDSDQTLDYRYFMNHIGENTTSEMFLKGAVAGEARSVFTGMIRIEPSGQGTNAHQTNRNLVLSDDAEAHSVPNLEILANDVRCGHGSAVGPLDEEQRYYLMSRGLPEARADRLQVLGFFEEALQRFPELAVEPILRAAAMAKYDRNAG
jgi:Fe-S cluster assembly protein SufD